MPETLIPTVAQRGTAVLNARDVSSAASVANAAIDHMRDWAAWEQRPLGFDGHRTEAMGAPKF